MPIHDIIDNREEKLVDHINRILGSTESARFAVGYFFLSGLESIAKSLAHVKELKFLIGNTTNRETLEQLAEGYHRLELVSEKVEEQVYPKRGRMKRMADETAENIREHHGIKAMLSNFGAPRLTSDNLFPAALLAIFVVMLVQSSHWSFEARIIPSIVGVIALITCSVSLANDIFSKRHGEGVIALADKAKAVVTQKIHMDIASKTAHLPGHIILIRGFVFFDEREVSTPRPATAFPVHRRFA